MRVLFLTLEVLSGTYKGDDDWRGRSGNGTWGTETRGLSDGKRIKTVFRHVRGEDGVVETCPTGELTFLREREKEVNELEVQSPL